MQAKFKSQILLLVGTALQKEAEECPSARGQRPVPAILRTWEPHTSFGAGIQPKPPSPTAGGHQGSRVTEQFRQERCVLLIFIREKNPGCKLTNFKKKKPYLKRGNKKKVLKRGFNV